ncbi:Ig-like domain-containing protein [uncultured Anaerofustis sp.]|uniref:Ig-like domain-containing protein n=1 Tax=uncultured Anaerofustis sp. TaxID=904996 RepID=UPI0025E951B7|nr:Ig-like domain-containing protein [uncultured Anaerofustis sp.]
MRIVNLKKQCICMLITMTLCLSFICSANNTILAAEKQDKSLIMVSENEATIKHNENDREVDTDKGREDKNSKTDKSALPILVSSIKVDDTSKSVYEGESFKLDLSVSPKSAESLDVIKWSSSDSKVAAVDQNGKVSAKNINTKDMIKKGITYKDAIITAYSNNGVKASCKVRVKVKLKGIELKPSIKQYSKDHVVLQTNKNKSTALKVSFSPSNAYNKGYKLNYSKKSFSVKKTGTNTYKVTAKSTKKPYSIYFSVSSAQSGKISDKKKVSAYKVATSIKVSNKKRIKASVRKHNINVGRTLSLKASSYPKSANNKSVTWKSSNPKIATVNSKGVVKGKKKGTVKITAYAKYNKSAKKTFTVKVHTPVKMSWPVGKSAGKKRYNVESLYGGSRGHKGVDIIVGVKSIYPAAKGKIVKVARNGGWGKYIVIKHPGGGKTLYSHMSKFSKNAKVGKKVSTKTYLGKSGRTGRATCSHLHFEIMNRKGKSFSAIKKVSGKDNHNAPFKKKGSKYVYDPDFIWQ